MAAETRMGGRFCLFPNALGTLALTWNMWLLCSSCLAGTTGVPVGWGDRYDTTGLSPNLVEAVAIGAAQQYTLVLTPAGKVVGWGRGDQGQLDIPASLTNVTAISVGHYFGMALPQDGRPVL